MLALLGALLVVAIKFLPWWASLLLLALGVVGVKWGTKHLLKQIFLVPFKMKGKALTGATVNIHDFVAAPTPSVSRYEDEAEDEETHQRYQQLNWYYIDLSIAPLQKSQECAFELWEPSELLLACMDVKAHDLENGFDSDDLEIHDLKIFQDGRFGEDEEGKYEGTQRLQLHIGLLPSIDRFQFRYYFELFGSIGVPTPIERS